MKEPSLLIPDQGHRLYWSVSKQSLRGRNTAWTGHQSITGHTHTYSHTHTLTPRGNLVSSQPNKHGQWEENMQRPELESETPVH